MRHEERKICLIITNRVLRELKLIYDACAATVCFSLSTTHTVDVFLLVWLQQRVQNVIAFNVNKSH